MITIFVTNVKKQKVMNVSNIPKKINAEEQLLQVIQSMFKTISFKGNKQSL